MASTDRHSTTNPSNRHTTNPSDRPSHGHQLQVHPRFEVGGKSYYNYPESGPTAGQVVAVLGGLPVGGTLLALSGVTLVATFVGLAVATPLFLIFSPVIVPAAVLLGLAVAAVLASGAFGVGALSSFSWVARQWTGMDEVIKRRAVETADYLGHKTRDLGQGIQNTAHSGIIGGDRDVRVGGDRRGE